MSNPYPSRRAAVFFVMIALLFGGCASEKPADLILIDGRIWTGTDTIFHEAVAIQGNKIVAVGKTSEIKKRAGASTQVINLNGKLATAGFNDAHIHFLGGSIGLSEVDLSGSTRPADVVDKVNAYWKANPTRTWITGRGWQYTSFASGLPDAETLKDITNDVPVFIKAYDGHSAWANKKALALAGIDRHTRYTGFGEIVKDNAGNPTGTLRESAMGLVGELVPPLTRDEKLAALQRGLALAASLGITSVQNANGSPDDLSLFVELLTTGKLTVRYAAAFSADGATTDAAIARFAALKDSVGFDNDMLRADAIKFMIDGVIESHTASMLEPYADVAPTDPLARGQLAIPTETYQTLVSKFDKLGFRIFTHAIGDNGVRESLNAYEQASRTNGKRDARHRIEHIETISPDDVPRFAQLQVLASMEPIHADPGTIGVWQSALGDTRLPWSFAWNTLLQHRAPLVYSSDWPACIDINPIRGIHVAVNRKTPEGLPAGGWIPEQKISMAQALYAYTAMGAYASFEENTKGQIQVGQLADIVVFSQNLFTIDPMKTHETKVVLTVFDGKVIYDQLN